jgi:hypothetical protein
VIEIKMIRQSELLEMGQPTDETLYLTTPTLEDEIRTIILRVKSKMPSHVYFNTNENSRAGTCLRYRCKDILFLCWPKLKITFANPCCDAARTLIGLGLHDCFIPCGLEHQESALRHYGNQLNLDLLSIADLQ